MPPREEPWPAGHPVTVIDEIPDDAYDLLPAEAVDHWVSSGELCGVDFPHQGLREWTEELRAEGHSEIEIACAAARIFYLELEEHHGLIERVPLPDGGAMIVERDPFDGLPLTVEE